MKTSIGIILSVFFVFYVCWLAHLLKAVTKEDFKKFGRFIICLFIVKPFNGYRFRFIPWITFGKVWIPMWKPEVGKWHDYRYNKKRTVGKSVDYYYLILNIGRYWIEISTLPVEVSGRVFPEQRF